MPLAWPFLEAWAKTAAVPPAAMREPHCPATSRGPRQDRLELLLLHFRLSSPSLPCLAAPGHPRECISLTQAALCFLPDCTAHTHSSSSTEGPVLLQFSCALCSVSDKCPSSLPVCHYLVPGLSLSHGLSVPFEVKAWVSGSLCSPCLAQSLVLVNHLINIC